MIDLTKTNHVISHTQTNMHKEHFLGRSRPWISAPRPQAGQPCLGGGLRALKQRQNKWDGGRLKRRKRRRGGEREAKRGHGTCRRAMQGPRCPVQRPFHRLPTPNLIPLGTVQVSSEREARAKKQSGVAGVSRELWGPRSTGDGEMRTPMGHKEPRQETVVLRPEAAAPARLSHPQPVIMLIRGLLCARPCSGRWSFRF